MCGRYRRTTSEEELARQPDIPIPPQLDLPISYNIAPTQNVLAIIRRIAILFARQLEAEMFDSMSGGCAEILMAEEVERAISAFGQQQFPMGAMLIEKTAHHYIRIA
jgi:putative SOS response-associated peptidase YedK